VNWKMGIDVMKVKAGEEDDVQCLFENRAAMDGGPKCTFRGKVIPCFVGSSPKASITSELLADMLKAIDAADVFERGPGQPKPFLLLDGHHSRMELAFLDYIHDPDHEWVVCIGVPYGTHIWQVADSSQLNGLFKIWLTKIKKEYWAEKADKRKGWAMTDIIPLVTRAYPKSFGNVLNAKKAIAERGWYPCNYVLLLHPEIVASKEKILGNDSNNEGTMGGNGSGIVSPTGDSGLTTINITKGAAGDATNDLIRHEMKSKGRVEAIRKRKAQQDNGGDAAERLNKMSRISSGKLASHGMYALDADVHREVSNRVAGAIEGDRQTQQRRAVRDESAATKQVAAWGKRHTSYLAQLDKGDLIALASAMKKSPTDSPLGKNKPDLTAQVKRRELRAVKERSQVGDEPSHYNLRVLNNALWREGDDREDILLLKEKVALVDELERRKTRDMTNDET
jgi:hypothetical protein